MRAVIRILAILCCLTNMAPASNAQTPVSIELVLAVDTSLSVNNEEFDLQMRGIANAFRSAEIVNLIGLYDGVAVTLIQWGGWTSEKNTVPWRLLKSEASILAFADEVQRTKRENVGYFTAIGTAVTASIKSLLENRFAGRLLKIDVSGDGINNAGPRPISVRSVAEELGISINGLAVRTDIESLDDYFRRELIAGPGAFVISARNYGDFGRAMQKKLKRELAVPISWRGEMLRKSSRGPLQAVLRQSFRLSPRSDGPPY
ncbi:MAG: DUF1194 domain-containing protein [Pseudomonadota bacterium]